jgi:hypothetical protein
MPPPADNEVHRSDPMSAMSSGARLRDERTMRMRLGVAAAAACLTLGGRE